MTINYHKNADAAEATLAARADGEPRWSLAVLCSLTVDDHTSASGFHAASAPA